MAKLDKANAICSIGTFVLTAMIVVLMLWPPQQHPATGPDRSHPVMIGWVMPSILAVCLLLAGVLHLMAARPRREPSPARAEVLDRVTPLELLPSSQSAPAPTPVLPVERIFLGPDITPKFLHTILSSEHTEIQARKLLDVYIGKWMKLSGTVNNIGEFRYGSSTVTFAGNSLSDPMVFMHFGEPWIEQLSVMRRGNDITAVGRVRSVDGLGVYLDDCELV